LDAAATIPDNFVTAFCTFFNLLSLPIPPSFPASSPPPLASLPILIYGAGSTAGQYAIQLLHSAGYKNIIATASAKNHDYLRSLGATSTFDYRSPDLVKDIATAVGGDGKVTLALDCITAVEDSMATIAKVISPQGSLAILLPVKIGTTLTVDDVAKMSWDIPEDKNPLPEGTNVVQVRAFEYQEQVCQFVCLAVLLLIVLS
jgi:NADPH:quinone reductase-like Zn-dependent oxidoreductase